MRLADIVVRYRDELEKRYGRKLLPGHRRALDAIAACRTSACGEVLLNCSRCGHVQVRPCSCGHRLCPACRNFETTVWLRRQEAKLLPVRYYMVTLTLPGVLRPAAWRHQREVYSSMFDASVEAMQELAAGRYGFGADIAMTGVLHTHSRSLGYHPHIHFIVPGGGIDRRNRVWKRKTGRWLFPQRALSKLFRGKLTHLLEQAGIPIPAKIYRHACVVKVIGVGSGGPALKYLARYLYRGVISERSILDDDGTHVTFQYFDNTGERHTRTLPGEQFLFLLLRHVLPKGFQRARHYGFLHPNARRTLILVHYVLRVAADLTPPPEPPAWLCPKCGTPMTVFAFHPAGRYPIRIRGSP